MMAAAQPFVSGAISKTVNLPNDCSVEDIEAIHLKAWQIGLKAIAIYRDGSKLSQPLNLSLPADSIASTAPAGDQPMSFGDRLRLPARRRGYTPKATVGGHRLRSEERRVGKRCVST